MTTQILKAFSYQSKVASGGVEALAIYRQHQNVISAVLTDIMMPETLSHQNDSFQNRILPKQFSRRSKNVFLGGVTLD